MLKKLYHRIWKRIENEYIQRRTYNKSLVNSITDLLYGEDKKNNTYDVFIKQQFNKRKLPTIFMFHGGGYVTGTKEGSAKICQQLAEKGFLVFNVEYTKCDREEKKYLPYQVFEFFKCYKHVTSSVYEDIIDYDNIFIAGNSAGGHIAALIANIQTNPELKIEYGLKGGPKVKGVILLSPSLGAYNFGGMFPKKQYHNVLFGKTDIRSELCELTHNLDLTTDAFPPTIMLSTKGDFVVGPHKSRFLDLAKNLNLSVQHYEICSGHKLFHSSMVEHADKYPESINKIADFINDACSNKFVRGLKKYEIFEKDDLTNKEQELEQTDENTNFKNIV